ncbi:hypothetical protein [Chryseobacterium wanjuense]
MAKTFLFSRVHHPVSRQIRNSAAAQQLYSNGDSTNGNVIVGYYYMTPRSTLTLPAGNYTVAVKGGGASDRGYTLTFGEGTADQIQIKATPVK